MDQKITIQNLIFGNLSFNFRFLAESPEANKNWQKDNSFYNTVSLKKPHLLYELCKKITLQKNILPQHSEKPTHFTNFSANMLLVGVWKHICTASFLDGQVLNSRSSWKVNLYVYLRISVRQFLFQRCSNFYLVGGWMVTLRRLAVFKIFKNFSHNWNFRKFIYFSALLRSFS